MSTLRYVAFLRGINVGGHTAIRMVELKKVFESVGLKQVKTLLASGNVIFETEQQEKNTLRGTIEHSIEQRLGHKVTVILRTQPEVQKLVKTNPFVGIEMTAQTTFYVSFCTEKLSTPAILSDEKSGTHGFYVHTIISNDTICSVVVLSPQWKTTEFMPLLEKQFGKSLTTRNWNTILKIAQM